MNSPQPEYEPALAPAELVAVPPPATSSSGRRRALQAGASTALIVVLLAVVYPHVTKTPWSAMLHQLRHLSIAEIGLLTLVWFAGIYIHTFLITASLPALTTRQALTMNLAGSAVSNVMPFGGAAGMAVGLAMTRSWGVRTSAFALSTLLTNLINTLAKLTLPLLALVALAVTHQLAGKQLTIAAAIASIAMLVIVALVCASLAYEKVAGVLGTALETVVHWLLRIARSPRTLPIRDALLESRRQCRDLLKRRWPLMSGAVYGYVALQGLLLWMILDMLGAGLTPEAVFAGFALERFLSLAVVTPGGIGISQTGTAALLVALGGNPAQTAAGILLYSVFTFLVEIPIGSAAGLLWWRRHRRRPPMITS
jgi:uncharacterized membrane protein YbhN (UPF0104 family)